MAWTDASAPIRAMVSGYASRYREQKLLIMLQGYIDDSSSEIGDRLAHLAGYVHLAPAWAEFSDAWDACLQDKPRIDYMRMVEAQNLSGQFRRWSAAERDRKVLALAQIIKARDALSVSFSVSRNEYEKIVAPVVPYELKSPYFASFYGLIVGVARLHAGLNIGVPVDFVFDEQEGAGQDVVLFYDYMKRNQPAELAAVMGATPVFRDDKKVMPLQAADMLAWHVRRQSEGRASAIHEQTLRILKGGNYHIGGRFPEDDLKSVAAKMAQADTSKIQTRAAWRRTRAEIRQLMAQGIDPSKPYDTQHGVRARLRAALTLWRIRSR